MQCKRCKRPANEVTIIHVFEKCSSYVVRVPGYCMRCHDYFFNRFIIILGILICLILLVVDWMT